MYILGDIGGTKIRLAVSRNLSDFEEPVIFKTPQTFEEGMAQIGETCTQLSGGEPIERIIFGIPGEFEKDGNALASSPNMPQWVGKPLRARVEEILHTPVIFKNDAALVGLGEAIYGAGKGFPIVAYITVSTGVGGARIVHGKMDEASVGFEPGHQIIDMDNSVQPQALSPATLEHYVGGEAIKKRFGVEPYEVRDPALWEELANYLAHGLYNTMLHWSPDAIVLGGSMIVGDPAISVDRVRVHLESMPVVFPRIPEIRKAALKDFGGLYGGMAFLKNMSHN